MTLEMHTHIVMSDQCQFGLTVMSDGGGKALAKKRTGFMTNSRCIAESLDKRCKGGHENQELLGGQRVRDAGIYPRQLCEAICAGLKKQQNYDKIGMTATKPLEKRQMVNLMTELRRCGLPEHWRDEGHETDGIERRWMGDRPQQGTVGEKMLKEELKQLMQRDGQCEAWDDCSGGKLYLGKVEEARKEEMRYIKKMKVYVKVPREEAIQNGVKPIPVRWLDINKGDAKNPLYRSRMVGKEFKTYEDPALYAATPPSEGLRYLLSYAVTNKMKHRKIMVNDVSRAFFNAPATRLIYIELPKEDDNGDNMVGRLRMSLYGTRDAALNWQEEVSRHLAALSFRKGRGFPCVFKHISRDLLAIVHGDDYVTVGSDEDLLWMRRKLEEKFEIKTSLVGHGPKDAREGKVLNRILRATEGGFEYEADPRHAELMIEAMGLQSAKGVTSPMVSQEDEGVTNDVELSAEKQTMYKAIAARGNYLSLDRPDLQFAV